jgi:hypothetical protein
MEVAMSEPTPVECLDTAINRLRQGRAIAEALLCTYIQQKVDEMGHEMSPQLMCDSLSALCDLLEQGIAASDGIRGVQVI